MIVAAGFFVSGSGLLMQRQPLYHLIHHLLRAAHRQADQVHVVGIFRLKYFLVGCVMPGGGADYSIP